jgi:hypothetical protein
MSSRTPPFALLALLTLAGSACSDDPVDPNLDAVSTALVAVQPLDGAAGIDVGANVVLTFDHEIGIGMEAYIRVVEGEVDGEDVLGSWTMSSDRMVLTFTPNEPFSPGTTYFIHMGGGMRDGVGGLVNLQRHGLGMGGEWVTEFMLTGGRGMGMGGQSHMGEGWQHTNGSYGMVFSFTTAD